MLIGEVVRRVIDIGRSVLVDVIIPDDRYGVREPGLLAVYDASQPPRKSL